MKRRRNASAFTLIERLVVVAFIALLISILLPSLSRAREQARQVKCASIMKQLGLGAHMYADSSDNYSAPLRVPGDWVSYPVRWDFNPKYRSIMGVGENGGGPPH